MWVEEQKNRMLESVQAKESKQTEHVSSQSHILFGGEGVKKMSECTCWMTVSPHPW